MILKNIIDTDSINYKKLSMVIGFPRCSFKCDKECGQKVCQNSPLVNEPDIDIEMGKIVDRYINNPLTEAIVMQGLEPFDSWEDLFGLISHFRCKTSDDIVIYTGYTEKELEDNIEDLKNKTTNIIIKFGRYVPNQESHKDELLGVNLASNNQYAIKIC